MSAALSAFGAPPAPAVALVIDQRPGQRLVRALGGLATAWLGAAAAVFIPVAHFILVPTFFATGLVVAVLRLRERRRLLGLSGTCPRCEVAQEFAVRGRFDGEREVACPRCHTRLRLTVAPPAPER